MHVLNNFLSAMFIFSELVFNSFYIFVYSGIFEINCSKGVKVQGIIGPCASLEKVSFKSVMVSLFPFKFVVIKKFTFR